ncbi:DUF2214 family protein [Brevundimonas sp.]|uniref:DUF2214 family protein n=1 Tax=Brevundimonas sp. TaxID=1871086 RepID=UPI003569E94D
MLDLTLAVLHHILVFGLVAMLAIERTLLKAPVIETRRLAGLDGGYGLTAVLVLAVGVARVIWGGKGWAFYEANPFFWAKVGFFAVIGLISILPTIAFIKWARATKANADWQPDATAVASARRWVGIELLLIIPLVACAAAMARWPF